jgi:hypothetical protein
LQRMPLEGSENVAFECILSVVGLDLYVAFAYEFKMP